MRTLYFSIYIGNIAHILTNGTGVFFTYIHSESNVYDNIHSNRRPSWSTEHRLFFTRFVNLDLGSFESTLSHFFVWSGLSSTAQCSYSSRDCCFADEWVKADAVLNGSQCRSYMSFYKTFRILNESDFIIVFISVDFILLIVAPLE